MKTKLVSFFFALCFSLSVFAYDACIDGIYYDLDMSTMTAVVTNETGDAFVKSYSGTVVIPASITYKSQKYSVTTIGLDAFYNCSGLTSVTIPNSVTTIGNYAFSGCSGLTSITIPNSVTTIEYCAFENCSGLTSITIGNSVTTIGGYAFKGCTSLTSVTINSNALCGQNYNSFSNFSTIFGFQVEEYIIGNSVTRIGDYAFNECIGLTSVTIGNSVTRIGECAFENCSGLTSITIGNSVTTIGGYAFSSCNGLKKTNYTGVITNWCKINFSNEYANPMYYSHNLYINNIEITSAVILNYTTTIGNYAFYNCYGLTSVTIPNSVTTIGSSAFCGCSLTSVTIPSSVTTIGDHAFAYSDLTSITIPNSITRIESGTFSYCSGLTSVIIPNSVTKLGEQVFSGCRRLTSISIPSSVSKISTRMFSDCASLTSIDLPNSILTIESYAFEGCIGLDSITLPISIKTIEEYAFLNCINLTSINLPTRLATVERYIFSGCKLFSVVIPNSVTNVDKNAFRGVTNIVYKGANTNAPWGAKCLNGYIDGYWVYSDSTKSILNACSYATAGTITIPNSVITIGENAFADCKHITSVYIPNYVTTIGNYAFSGCSGLTSINIPYSVREIGASAFEYCSNLLSVIIPSSVKKIHMGAFFECSGLISITSYAILPPTCWGLCFFNVSTSIPVYVPAQSVAAYKQADEWQEFTNIQALPKDSSEKNDNIIIYEATNKLPETTSSTTTGLHTEAFNVAIILHTFSNGYGTIFFADALTNIGNNAFYNCKDLTSITIPNSVTTIGAWAFASCSELTSISIGNAVTTIGNGAFEFCYNNRLTSITIPNSVTTIGDDAFANCNGLTSITISKSVTTIGKQAFSNCSYLSSITSYAVVPPTCNNNCFIGVKKSIPLNVPMNSVGLYKQADVWKDFTNIQAITNDSSEENNKVIIYEATSKLPETTSSSTAGAGLHIEAFNMAITSHTFSNGYGTIVFADTLTDIGDYAFYNCKDLTSITIPNSITTIGSSAFLNCKGLIKTNYTSTIADWCKIRFGNGTSNPMNYSHNFFINDVEVKDLVIPASVDTIGSYAFYNCSGLTSVTIPNSITTIGSSAFYNCSGLTSVTIPNSITTIGSSAFLNCKGLIKTNYTSTIADWCKIRFGNGTSNPMNYSHNFFINDVEVKDLVVPASVDTIGSYAFYNCSGLTSVTIPNSVTTIGSSAFSSCSGLTKTNYTGTIADWCKIKFSSSTSNPIYYSKNFFINDVEVKDLVIPASVDTIGDCAFYNCSSLTSVTIPNSVTTIGSSAFYNCSGLTSVTIPNSVTTIESSTFYNCNGLTETNYTGTIANWCKIKFSGSATSNPIYYSKNFFINDVEVKELVIPQGVDTIGNYAFYGCKGLTSVIIDKSVTTIGNSTFGGCNGLTSITSYATTPPTCGSSCFYNVDKSIPLYVSAQSVDAYKQADKWKEFTNILPIISAEPTQTIELNIEPTETEVTITWPKDDNASSYSIEITQDGVVFCTLKFNAQGQLIGIAFVPSRGMNNNATDVASGFKFTITNLTPNTTYDYVIVSKDASDQVINSYSGTFTTKGGVVTKDDQLTNSPNERLTKVIKNNQLFIRRGDKLYNAAGQKVK